MNASRSKIKVAVVVDEYFGGAGTPFGGYGFLARHIVCRHLPSPLLTFEVLLSKKKKIWNCLPTYQRIDGVTVITPPSKSWLPLWLYLKGYDAYLTIELTHDILKYDLRPWKKIIHWIQDPRPWYVWRKIASMNTLKEFCFFNEELNGLVKRLCSRGQTRFISQGPSLDDYARDLYCLPDDVPITPMPNPVPVDMLSSAGCVPKENLIIFLGRLESQKRGWLFCEVARRMPQYQFVVIGKLHRSADENRASLQEYMDGKVPNLHFAGHLDGDAKSDYIRRAKILLNTSVWEGIPLSFLEALSAGTLIVSNLNPDRLPERFGAYIGDVPGDGFGDVDRFVSAIDALMMDEERRKQLAREAVCYIKQHHSIETFVENMRNLLYEEGTLSRGKKKACLSQAWRKVMPVRRRQKACSVAPSLESRRPSHG